MSTEMKFEESKITGYLVKNLGPLTEADPEILAKYVAALLKKDKPAKELQKLCTENLTDFLGKETEPFISKLFQALEDGTVSSSRENPQVADPVIGSSAALQADDSGCCTSSLRSEKAAERHDPEEKEISDDDDDDRNHKHRRRETQPLSCDQGFQEPYYGRKSKEKFKSFENGHAVSEMHKENSASFDNRGKFDKQRLGSVSLSKFPYDLGQRIRGSPSFAASCPELSIRSVGKGRGRGGVAWSQQESRFATGDAFDFASQVNPQVAAPGFFTGSVHSSPWSPFGLIPGPNAGLDALHSLALSGAFGAQMNRPLNLAVPRQRCRDFEERGFCLSGDMCPMEHGVNRIVVEDVQSLSQFNLPVSVPSVQLLGIKGGRATVPSLSMAPKMLATDNDPQSKSSKTLSSEDMVGSHSKMLNSSELEDTEFYDPDQPLWTSIEPEHPGQISKLPATKSCDSDVLWNVGPAEKRTRLDKNITHKPGSIWGRIRKSENAMDTLGGVCPTTFSENEMMLDQAETELNTCGTYSQIACSFTEEIAPRSKYSSVKSIRGNHTDPVYKAGGEASQKASRTLFVSGIPVENNKHGALLSHFKKFGEIVDIYIPHNKERAFVQFARREDAEAALKAPDAVMGNRFIKLWWANRDRVPVAVKDNQTSAYVSSEGNTNTVSLQNQVPKRHETPANSGSTAYIHQKASIANENKAVMQKKLESLETLKEELRRKQEMLEQKRNDFRQQLDKLSKKAITAKRGRGLEHAVGRQNTDPADAGCQTICLSTADSISVENESRDSCHSVETIPLDDGSKAELIIQSHEVAPRLSNCLYDVPEAFSKAENSQLPLRPAKFQVVPPLPSDFADVAVVEKHFSTFGELSSVEMEAPEGMAELSQSSAYVSFKNFQSAEAAFHNGKVWKGFNLQFMWPTLSSGNDNVAKISNSTFVLERYSNTNTEVMAPLSSCSDLPQDDASGSGLKMVGSAFCEDGRSSPCHEHASL